MLGVLFNQKHSYVDWGLIMAKTPVISPPEPKTKYVDIIGMDGVLDLTETLSGKVRYNTRNIEMEFITMAGRENWPAIYSGILNALHGKKVSITFDDDILNHYTGRVTVGEPEFEKAWVVLKMTAEVEPYKTSNEGKKSL